jgi:hypothetical protein
MYEKAVTHKFTLKHPTLQDGGSNITIEFKDDKTALAWLPIFAKFDAYLDHLKFKATKQ